MKTDERWLQSTPRSATSALPTCLIDAGTGTGRGWRVARKSEKNTEGKAEYVVAAFEVDGVSGGAVIGVGHSFRYVMQSCIVPEIEENV